MNIARNEIFDQLKTMLANLSRKPETEVLETTKMEHIFTSAGNNDHGLDSLDLAEFIMECEDHWNVEIPDRDVHDCKTVGDHLDVICRKVC